MDARRFKLIVSYDGTAYNGWQVQPDQPSVQQKLEEVLRLLTGQKDLSVHGSGRTDQGVHARGQVAHVDLATRMGPDSLVRAMNSHLPADIRILKASIAAPDFDARRSTVSKEYRYFIWNDPVVLPDKRLYAAHAYRPLDAAAMDAAARRFIGKHDFAAFTANPHREIGGTVRTIFAAEVRRHGRELVFRVRGDGFLYKQVRSMAGFLMRVGEGAEAPEAVGKLLSAAESRTARVPTAPPQGLFLWKVWYK